MTDIDKLAREISERTYREGPMIGPKARQLAVHLGLEAGMKLQRERDADFVQSELCDGVGDALAAAIRSAP